MSYGNFKGRVLLGDCRILMPNLKPFDLIIADPPYSETSLSWDKKVEGWLPLAAEALKPTCSIWVFGSMRFLMEIGPDVKKAGLRLAQDIVWEKHNGAGFQNDRFKKVHEHAVHLYRLDSPWKQIYNDVQITNDARARTVRQKTRPPHMGDIGEGHYVSVDGGPRIRRSVIYLPSCHGYAIHPTQKHVELLEILIRTSCPEGGLVGDWFDGSGSAGEACACSDRKYIGCEKDADMVLKANARLGELLL